MIRIITGFDQREAVAFHAFYQSIITNSSTLVQITPLAINTLREYRETHLDGSNTFTYSRFLTPYLCNFEGWAIFADGDMVCQADITELWNLRDETKAVLVVQHDYETKQTIKYFDQPNADYPRKNWSSLVVFNCGHSSNKVLTPAFINSRDGAFLHRFSWLADEEIGELNLDWNYLAIEYAPNANAKLIHYTLGTPCFEEFKSTELSEIWWETYQRAIQGIGD